MPLEQQLAHRVFRDPAYPYITNTSPLTTDSYFASGSADILTSIAGYAQRRPGFANTVEATPTTFNNLQRLFTWDRFDGTFYIMACDVNASGFAQVYKLAVGIDASFVSIYIDNMPTVFDFVTSNNTVYFSNGNVALKWDPVNGLSNWGIAIGSISETGTATAATGATSGSGAPWANPGNVSSAVSFATLTLPGGSESVASVTINTTGSGYNFGTFNLAFTGGGGSGAAGTFFAYKGHLVSTNVYAGGTSYTSAPAVSFAAGGGTGGTGTANMTGGAGGGAQYGQALQATNYSLGISAGATLKTIQATFTAIATVTGGGSATVTCPIQLILNGSPVGSPKLVTFILDGASHTYSTTADLWNTTISGAAAGSTSFGFQIVPALTNVVGGYTLAIQANNFQMTVTFLGGPQISVSASAGTFAATNGYQYVECFGNSNTGHVSSPSPPSVSTGSFSTKLNVQVTLTASTDPQVNQIRVFRTTDSASGLGGQSYFELPTSPYPNIQWTLSAAANAAAGSTVYTGIPIGGSGFASSVGQNFVVSGFTNAANNGTFPCTAATLTTITLTNSGGVAESHAATANEVALDAAPDAQLNIYAIAPTPTFNDPPTPIEGVIYYSGRIWGFTGNKVWFTGLEEITIGVPEECMPSGIAGTFYAFDQPVQSIGVAGTGSNQALVVKSGGRLYGISGNTLDTFQRTLISNRRGSRNRTCDTMLGGMNAWLDSANQVWATDNSTLQELSIPIRPDLTSITQSNCSMTFHTAGLFHWLILSTGSKLYVYDIDNEQWMPPWTFAAKYIFSGETSPGNYVLMASTGTKAVQLSTSAFNDQGATYQPVIVTNLMSTVPDYGKRFSYIGQGMYDEPSRTGVPFYVEVDTNKSAALSDVQAMQDDDPTTASYTSIFGSLKGADETYNRSAAAVNIIQNVFPQNAPSCRWYGLKIILQNADSLDKVYGWFLAYKALGGR